ncbi:hypothetical protein [Methanosarcina horonobensis]|uniref:hypothetical protein n=1 Tax=Methanosarcina horonobensis TaxID=418008 RepID=UPI000A4F59BB|nr:hypothetical protein [Methanosarcina horonobensis]
MRKYQGTRVIIAGALILVLVAVLLFSTYGQTGQSEDESTLIQASSHDIGDINGHLYGGAQMAQGMVYETLVENTVNGPGPSLRRAGIFPKTARSIPSICLRMSHFRMGSRSMPRR